MDKGSTNPTKISTITIRQLSTLNNFIQLGQKTTCGICFTDRLNSLSYVASAEEDPEVARSYLV